MTKTMAQVAGDVTKAWVPIGVVVSIVGAIIVGTVSAMSAFADIKQTLAVMQLEAKHDRVELKRFVEASLESDRLQWNAIETLAPRTLKRGGG